MSVFEMPLEQLKTYKGTNPRPADFDRFWEDALSEMRSVKPDIALKPAEFHAPYAECFDLTFTGVGGARIYAKYARPKHKKSGCPAILFFHGYRGNSGNWYERMPYVAAGFSIFAMDCRGQGGRSEDISPIKGNTHHGHIIRGLDEGPEHLLFRQIFLDTAELASIAMSMDEVDPEKLCVTGMSQGGALTIACSSLEPRVKRLAPVLPFLSDYKRVWEMDLAKDAYEELKEYFRLFDPRHEREEEIFTRLGYIDIHHLSPRIKGETLFFTALSDTICPPSTQFAAYNNIRSKKRMVIYPDFGHEDLPGGDDEVFTFFLDLA